MTPLAHSSGLSPWNPGIFSLIVYSLFVAVFIIAMLIVSGRLGKKNPGLEKLRAYESGIIPTGSARLRYPVPFYLVAIFFLLFDVEAAFIFSWAIAMHDLGWSGWLQITFFIFVLILGLVYIWRKGGLEWAPTARNE